MLNEIIVDVFAGGGGASSGIACAVGRSVDVAIDHDPAAIVMHRANHPHTKHYRVSCRAVWNGMRIFASQRRSREADAIYVLQNWEHNLARKSYTNHERRSSYEKIHGCVFL